MLTENPGIPPILNKTALTTALKAIFIAIQQTRDLGGNNPEANKVLQQIKNAKLFEDNSDILNFSFNGKSDEQIREYALKLALCFMSPTQQEITKIFSAENLRKDDLLNFANLLQENLKLAVKNNKRLATTFVSEYQTIPTILLQSAPKPTTLLQSAPKPIVQSSASQPQHSHYQPLPISTNTESPYTFLPSHYAQTNPQTTSPTILHASKMSHVPKLRHGHPQSDLRQPNLAKQTLHEIRHNLETAVSAHNDAYYFKQKIEWNIKQHNHNNQLVIEDQTNHNKQIGTVEKLNDNVVYQFSDTITFDTADIILRASQDTEFTLTSEKIDDIKNILEAANAKPHNEGEHQKTITLSEKTLAFLHGTRENIPKIVQDKIDEQTKPPFRREP